MPEYALTLKIIAGINPPATYTTNGSSDTKKIKKTNSLFKCEK